MYREDDKEMQCSTKWMEESGIDAEDHAVQ